MTKEFATYEQALALKELGFDEPCIAFHNKLKFSNNISLCFLSQRVNNILNTVKNTNGTLISAPLYQQAFRWFREKQYYSEINVGCTQIDGAVGFSWRIWKPWIIEEWSPERPGEEWSYETYEESESACLDKLIAFVSNKQ